MKVSEIFIKSSEIIPRQEIIDFLGHPESQVDGIWMPQLGYSREDLVRLKERGGIAYYYKITQRTIGIWGYSHFNLSGVGLCHEKHLYRWQLLDVDTVYRMLDDMRFGVDNGFRDALGAPISDILKWNFYKDIHNFMPKDFCAAHETERPMVDAPVEKVQPMTSENNHRDSLLPVAEAVSVPVVEEAVSVPVVEEAVSVPVVEESKKTYLRPYLTLIDLTMENMVACASDYNSPEEIFEKVDFKNEDVEAWMRFDTHAARELKVSTPTETFHSTAELKKKIEKLEAQLEAVRAERHELKKEVRALKKTIEDKDAIIYSEKRKNMILLSPEEFDRRAEEEERLAAAAQEAEVQAAAKAERKKKFFLFRDNRFLSYFFENRVSYLDGIFLLIFFVCLVSLLGTNCAYNGVSYLKEVLMTGISSFFISAISIGWKNTEPSEYTKNNNSCPSPKKSGETAKLVEHISEGLIDVLIGTLLGSGKGKRRKH